METITKLLLRLPGFNGSKRMTDGIKLTICRLVCIILAIAFAVGAVYSAIGDSNEIIADVYKTSSQSGARYAIELNDNSFFTSSTLKMDGNYIRSLVRTVDIVFTHKFSAVGSGEAEISYDVVGEVSTWLNENDSKRLLWSKSEQLASDSDIAVSGSDYSFEVPINVNQSIYAGLLEDFNAEMELNAVGFYDVKFTAKSVYTANGEKKEETTTAVVSIPLGGKVFTPVITAEEEPSEVEFTTKIVQSVEPNKAVVGLLSALAVIALLAFVIFALCFAKKEKDAYLTELHEKISSIQDRIAYVKGVNESAGENIALTDFDSLVHLADERVLPILCAKDDKAHRAVFFVIENMQKFYYVFDDSQVSEDED